MDGGQRIAESLWAHGARCVFTLCGGHISPILVAAKSRGIDVVDVRDEATAVFAADAVARLTGIPGVAAVTAGPGVTNTITAVENARLAQSPLVLLGGATATVLAGRGALQDIDQLRALRPHVKRVLAVRRVGDLGQTIARAFALARDGVPGPVFVQCPVDVLFPEHVVRDWYAKSMPPRGPARWYLRRHLERMLDAPPVERSPSARGRPAVVIPPRAIGRAAGLLARAERPVLLVGTQALAAGADSAALARAVDALGVPVFLSGMARGLLGPAHALQFRHARKQALREADLVLLAGVPCDFRLDYGGQINRRARLCAANRSRAELRLNRRPDIAVHAPADAFLVALAARGGGAAVPARGTWLAALRAREAARDAEIAALAAVPAPPVNPLALCRAIDRTLGPGAIVVADGGDFVASASYIVRPRGPLGWLDPGAFGTLGVGAGFVLGAHAARPGAELWALFGDGAFGFALAEFHTLARRGVPVIAVIGNDGAWSQIARDQVALLGDEVGTVLGRASYERAVEALGAAGFLLDDQERIEETLGAARAAARAGRPAVVNALIGSSEFRKGSISL